MSSPHSPSFVLELLSSLRLSWRLLWDRRMPLWTKSVPAAAAMYLLWPIDILADPLLGIGQVDDLAIILLAARLFISLAPIALLADLDRESVPPSTVDGQSQVLDVEGKTHLLHGRDVWSD